MSSLGYLSSAFYTIIIILFSMNFNAYDDYYK